MKTLLVCAALVMPATAQTRIVDDLPGAFLNIVSTGNVLALSNDGVIALPTTIGNALFPAGIVRVGANGGARFGTSTLGLDLSPSNAPLPNAGAFNFRPALLPYWDALDISVGQVLYAESGDTLIIQWHNVRVIGAPFSDRITFQLQVHRRGPILAQLAYLDIEAGVSAGGTSATIGFQAFGAGSTVQHAWNARNVVSNGLVLSIVDDPNDVLVTDTLSGTAIDLALTGTALNLADEEARDVTTGIESPLLPRGVVRVGSNGGLRLAGTGTTLPRDNAPIPSPAAFGGARALLGFWDDLDSGAGAFGQVFVRELPERLVVHWRDVGFGQNTASRVDFQAQLFNGRPLVAQLLYTDVQGARAASGGSATIGYQSGGTSGHVPFSFDTPSVSNGTVLSFLHVVDPPGTVYCGSNPNSTSFRALLRGEGSTSLARNDLRLVATHLPQHSAAYFLVATETGFVANVGGGRGNLCLGGVIGRKVGGAILSSGPTGTVTTDVDLTALPAPNGTFHAQIGDTLHFQCWFRDTLQGNPTSNLSEALQVRVAP
jgi:hypothetical protein